MNNENKEQEQEEFLVEINVDDAVNRITGVFIVWGLFFVFLHLKLSGDIDWNWLFVFSPLLISFVIWLVTFIFTVIRAIPTIPEE